MWRASFSLNSEFACMGYIKTSWATIALRFSSAARRPNTVKGSYPEITWFEEKHGEILPGSKS